MNHSLTKEDNSVLVPPSAHVTNHRSFQLKKVRLNSDTSGALVPLVHHHTFCSQWHFMTSSFQVLIALASMDATAKDAVGYKSILGHLRPI